jgi:hypothetical protein
VDEALAQERQSQFSDLSLQGGHLLAQQTDLLVQLIGIWLQATWLLSRSGSWLSLGFLSRVRYRSRQRATMQFGQRLLLCKSETLETSICGMQTTGELSGSEPKPQGFGINP